MTFKELLYIVLFIVATTETFAFMTILSTEPLIDNRILRTRKFLPTVGPSKSGMIPSRRRRSPRLIALDTLTKSSADSSDEPSIPKRSNKRDSARALGELPVDLSRSKRPRRKASMSDIATIDQCPSKIGDSRISNTKTSVKKKSSGAVKTLPRTVEDSVRSQNPHVQYVMGIDEAGRGPLAGPVVVAAVRMAMDHPVRVEGVTDSKKITCETQREVLYEQLMASLRNTTSNTSSVETSSSTNILWAVAVIDAATIDKINILQATLLGMELVASAIMEQAIDYLTLEDDRNETDITQRSGCFVVVGRSNPLEQRGQNSGFKEHQTKNATESASSDSLTTTSQPLSKYFALIDGNRLPKHMPCPAEALIKGDSREYCIAAASILAKVTRDRIMHRYHAQYPEYNFAQHKGYPTAAHVQAIRLHGPSPIHRMSFAPLKKPTKRSKK
jgi:ribonuclease HII